MPNEGPRDDRLAGGYGLACLAVASGSADVIAFLTLGHVFASAMTGNTALLGIALSEGDLAAASQPITALLGFAAGAALAATLYNPAKSGARQPAILRRLLLLEIACLGAFAIVLQASGGTDGGLLYLLIVLSSLAMGIQGIAAKRINAPGVNTIVFTSTLVSVVLSVSEILLRRDDSPALRKAAKQQIATFGAYGAGAVAAGLLDWGAFALLAWMPVAAVALAMACFEADRARAATA